MMALLEPGGAWGSLAIRPSSEVGVPRPVHCAPTPRLRCWPGYPPSACHLPEKLLEVALPLMC